MLLPQHEQETAPLKMKDGEWQEWAQMGDGEQVDKRRLKGRGMKGVHEKGREQWEKVKEKK